MVEFAVMLLAGLWMAVNPEGALRLVQDAGTGVQRFRDSFRGFGAPYFPIHIRPEPSGDSHRVRLAMRCFGIAAAGLAFLGLLGIGR